MGNNRFKYRVWDNEEKCYQESDADYCRINYNGELECMFTCDNGIGCRYEYIQDHCIIEQCTGFRDKTGKLIYENDVLLFFERLRGVVKWEHGGWFVSGEGIYQPLCDAYASAEVVGNIHDAEAKGGEE